MANDIHWECRMAVCRLDNTRSTSPPTAFYNLLGDQCWAALLGDPTLNIPWGSLTIQIYPVADARLELIFRHGNPYGYPWVERHYRVILTEGSRTELWRYDPPDWFFLGDYPGWWTLDQWTKIGIAWWPQCSLDAIPALGVSLAVFDNDTPTIIGNVIDPLNKWADEPTNRIALSMYDGPFWVDDFVLFTLP